MKQPFTDRMNQNRWYYVHFLIQNSNLKLKDIENKPEIFSASLEMLIVSAARAIEQIILKNLYSGLGLEFEEKQGYEFADYILELK